MTADGLKMTKNNNLDNQLESLDGTIDSEYNIDGMKIKIHGEFNKNELEKSVIDSNKKLLLNLSFKKAIQIL